MFNTIAVTLKNFISRYEIRAFMPSMENTNVNGARFLEQRGNSVKNLDELFIFRNIFDSKLEKIGGREEEVWIREKSFGCGKLI